MIVAFAMQSPKRRGAPIKVCAEQFSRLTDGQTIKTTCNRAEEEVQRIMKISPRSGWDAILDRQACVLVRGERKKRSSNGLTLARFGSTSAGQHTHTEDQTNQVDSPRVHCPKRNAYVVCCSKRLPMQQFLLARRSELLPHS